MKKSIKRLTAIILVLVLALSMAGCNEVEKAETSVNNMFKAFKALDFEEAKKYVDVTAMVPSQTKEGLTDDTTMFMENLFDRLDYKIISSEKIDSKNVRVKTEITAVDMKSVLIEYIPDTVEYMFSVAFAYPQPTEEEIDEKLEEIFIEKLSETELSTVTTEVIIQVYKDGSDWKIQPDDDFVDAIFGKLQAAIEELEKTLNVVG